MLDPSAIPPADRIMSARIAGVASRWAPYACPTGDDLAAAIKELREVATERSTAGKEVLRTDLLGQAAGLARGHEQYRLQTGGVEMGYAARAELLIAAGADLEVAALWVEEGVRRARPVMPPRY